MTKARPKHNTLKRRIALNQKEPLNEVMEKTPTPAAVFRACYNYPSTAYKLHTSLFPLLWQ